MSDGTAVGGTYVLVIELATAATITVGALGDLQFSSGGYAYVGSAHGPGGFTRLDRHRRIATGVKDVRHWHIDYLLGETEASIVDSLRIPDQDLECAIAGELARPSIPGFGCSDCTCDSHLFYAPTVETIRAAATEAATLVES